MWVWEGHAGQGLCLVLAALLLSAAAQPLVSPVDASENPEAPMDGRGGVRPTPLKPEGLRHHIKLFIGILSLYEHADLRGAARETWIPIAKATHAVAVRFFCYVESNDESMMGWMKNEQAVHRDIVIVTPETLGGHDSLRRQPWQTRLTLNLLNTATERFEPDFIMRAADNAYMNIPVIMRLLRAQRGQGPIWYGHAKPGALIPHGDVRHLESIKQKELLEDVKEQQAIPQYMDGAGAIMSANVVEALLRAQRLVGLRMLNNADAAVGLWLSAFQMRYINNTEAGCSARPFQPTVEGGENAEWNAAEGRVLCLSHEMPLAVVHPLTPDLMTRVLASATACRDTLSRTHKD